MMLDHSAIAAFWDWFATYSDRIRDAYRREDRQWLDLELSPRVQHIDSRLQWEIGPYHPVDDAFVLSPSVRENLPLTRAAMAIAPKLEGWRFLYAKPPKQLLSLAFTVDDCTIHADDWRYRLIAYNDGEFVDIELFIPAHSHPPIAHLNVFCEWVVESLIGEECRLDRVGELMPQIVEDNRCVEQSTPIQHLQNHLKQALAPTPPKGSPKL